MGQWKIRLHNSSISFTGMIPLRKISVGLDRRIGSTEISIFQLVLSITFSVNPNLIRIERESYELIQMLSDFGGLQALLAGLFRRGRGVRGL